MKYPWPKTNPHHILSGANATAETSLSDESSPATASSWNVLGLGKMQPCSNWQLEGNEALQLREAGEPQWPLAGMSAIIVAQVSEDTFPPWETKSLAFLLPPEARNFGPFLTQTISTETLVHKGEATSFFDDATGM